MSGARTDTRFDRALEWLRKSSARPTPARVSVASVLLEQEQPISAEQLYRRLAKEGEEVSLGSVYRILRQFEDEGLVRKEWQISAFGQKGAYVIEDNSLIRRGYVLRCVVCERQQRIVDAGVARQLSNSAALEGYELAGDPVVQVRCQSCRP